MAPSWGSPSVRCRAPTAMKDELLVPAVSGAAQPPLRALFVIDSLGGGGAQRQLVNIGLTLHQMGHEVDFFTYARGDLFLRHVQEAGCQVYSRIKSARFSPGPVLSLRRLMSDKKYDVALSFLPTPSIYTLLAKLTAGQTIPVIISERSNGQAFLGPPASRGKLLLYRVADAIVVNSFHLRAFLIARLPWMRDRVHVIYNGVDLNAFCPSSRQQSVQDTLRILVVASVSPMKNGLCLIEALSLLKQNDDIRPHVTWVGEHQNHISERRVYSERMQRSIVQSGLAGQWTWLPPQKDVAVLYQTHDVLVHPSCVEGLPNVVCEALASGLPVIVSDTLDHPILVQDGQSGFLFDWTSPQSLAMSIRRFAGLSAESRLQMGRCGRAFAESHLSMQRCARAFECLLAGVVGTGSTA